MYIRTIQSQIEEKLFQGKVIVLFGARRVGKTTLSQAILSKFPQDQVQYYNCENSIVQEAFGQNNPEKIRDFFGGKTLIVLDEAQVIPEIGKRLKIMIDTFPQIQIIATGSSSFELANQVGEPLVGRQYRFWLQPLSIVEISQNLKYQSILSVEQSFEKLMTFGLYPSIFDKPRQESLNTLSEMTESYLFKDILMFENLKKSKLLSNLIKLLSLSLGKEISLSWVAQRLNTSVVTVDKYIYLLEQTFVIFRLTTLNRNLKKEISQGFKVYFWDLGIRNQVINNFNSLDLRNDVGEMWENFCIAERLKKIKNENIQASTYFWRTYDQQEIDYIEEKDGNFLALECKWSKNKSAKIPKIFMETYPNTTFDTLNPETWYKWLK